MWKRGIVEPGRDAKFFPAVGEIDISGFLGERIRTNREVSIPALYKLFLKYGEVNNFKIVAGEKKGEISRRLATDSNLYKWMEAVAFDLNNQMDKKKEKLMDNLISTIGRAQESSGYLNTFYTGKNRKQRLRNLIHSHELYCGGHLIQAAIAYHRATGKDNLLNIAIKWADYICKKFGKGKIEENDGHPEVEMALVELYRETGKERYLELAEYFMSLPYKILGDYSFLQFPETLGHAVRMLYLLSGATDYYIETANKAYHRQLLLLWDDLLLRKAYITGGIGARYTGEAIGLPYELPNERAYAETCAAVALMMWSFRMFLAEGKAEFMDAFETTLYNGFLSGISLDGLNYFYTNPLASRGNHKRHPWYGCCCCPPNVQRILAGLPAYFYAVNGKGVAVNLYSESESCIDLPSGNKLAISQRTDYPFEGRIVIDIKPEKKEEFSLFLRIPGWVKKYSAKANGQPVSDEDRGYLEIKRVWEPVKNTIELDLEIKPVLYRAHSEIESTKNCVAIKRGPLIYCLEDIDNPEINLFNCKITDAPLKDIREDKLLGGIYTVSGEVLTADEKLPLYEEENHYPEIHYRRKKFKAIPYYTWANRGTSSMVVWMEK